MLDGLVPAGCLSAYRSGRNPSGVIYLDAGEITFAQASWVLIWPTG